MTRGDVTTQGALGRRIAQSREETGFTQARLAGVVGLERSALAKIESGARKVSATELVSIADALDRSVDSFVSDAPPAVISRRRAAGDGHPSRDLDARVDRIGRDIAFLVAESVLPRLERESSSMPANAADAERLAATARTQMGIAKGPLLDLQDACERVGLLTFALDLGDDAGDAAYVEVDGWGIAVINGSRGPGRRRFNLAHELGHHLIGDAYASEVMIDASGGTERLIDAFVAHLLMPRAAVTALWDEVGTQDRRLAALAVAVRFRVSWTAALGHLRNLGLVSVTEYSEFKDQPPRGGDFVELGERWVSELDAPAVPNEYGRRVIRAYRASKLTAARTVELLWNTVQEAELPDLDPMPVDALRRELDPMR